MSRADVCAAGWRRGGAGSADLVVHEVVEEVVQVHLEGLVLRLRVGADVDAAGVHADEAEEGKRVRREDLSTEKRMPVALACCWMILVMMCASTPLREGGWMGVSGRLGDGPTSSPGATKQPHPAAPHPAAHIILVLLPMRLLGSLAGWNAELALSWLSGIRVLVEAVDALDGQLRRRRRLANITHHA